MRTNIHIKTRLSTTTNTQDRLNVAFLMIRRLKYENDVLTAKCEKEDQNNKIIGESYVSLVHQNVGFVVYMIFVKTWNVVLDVANIIVRVVSGDELRVINCSKNV